MPNNPKRELAYYLSIFKVKGHETWRSNFCQSAEGLKDSKAMAATLTDEKIFRIDKITGEITSVK